MANNGWMTKNPLGKLESTTGDLNYTDHPRHESKNSLSKEKNELFECYRSKIITLEELRAELKTLKN